MVSNLCPLKIVHMIDVMQTLDNFRIEIKYYGEPLTKLIHRDKKITTI